MIKRSAKRAARLILRNTGVVSRPAKKAYKNYKQTLSKRAYHVWAEHNEELCFAEDDYRHGPLVSIIVPAYNPLATDFTAMVFSVINQHYENWELIIVNGSSDGDSRAQIDQAAQIDTRIIVISDVNNEGIGKNTNVGLARASGDYIAFLDHDDIIHHCALHASMQALQESKADASYCDEDKITADSSQFFDPFFKPKFSLDLLRNVNYINHFSIMKRSLVSGVEGIRPAFDGAQDYDLWLRVYDETHPKIIHVGHVLYHWRAAATSTASSIGTKSYVLDAGTRALQEHLERNKLKVTAHAIANRPGFYQLGFLQPKRLTVVIGPVAPGNHRLCAHWLASLLPYFSSELSLQLVIGSWFKPFAASLKDIQFSYSDEMAVSEASTTPIHGEVVLYLGEAVLPVYSETIASLIGRAYQGDCVVAPMIINDNHFILDAGFVEASYGLQPLFREIKLGDSTTFGTTEWVRNVASLSLDVYATSAEKYRLLSVEESPQVGLRKLLKAEPSTRLVMDALSPVLRKGQLSKQPLINDSFFNPELSQAFAPSISVSMSSWGAMKEDSERDHA